MYCGHCGAPIMLGQRFCASCGAPVVVPRSSASLPSGGVLPYLGERAVLGPPYPAPALASGRPLPSPPLSAPLAAPGDGAAAWKTGWATNVVLAILGAVFLIENARPGGSESRWVLYSMGAITPDTLSGGHLWRLVASTFLHIGLVHLLGNAIALFWLGRMAERLYGPLRYAGIYLSAGLGGAVLTALVGVSALTAGASGAIWGIMGALLIGSWRNRDRAGRIGGREIRQSIAGVIILNALISLTPGVSLTAHAGGFLAGAALGAVIPFKGGEGRRTRALGAAVGIVALASSGALLLTALA